mmetsp:Transcript_14666/g.52787  ORF Transcript_14666/g.52787 Transcript_14666/m.52787 type:complete len:209 (+) Transcript_14666:234-860(+)
MTRTRPAPRRLHAHLASHDVRLVIPPPHDEFADDDVAHARDQRLFKHETHLEPVRRRQPRRGAEVPRAVAAVAAEPHVEPARDAVHDDVGGRGVRVVSVSVVVVVVASAADDLESRRKPNHLERLRGDRRKVPRERRRVREEDPRVERVDDALAVIRPNRVVHQRRDVDAVKVRVRPKARLVRHLRVQRVVSKRRDVQPALVREHRHV